MTDRRFGHGTGKTYSRMNTETQWPLVLIAAPTFDGKRYSQFDWIEQLSLLTYPNFKVFLSDNSHTKDFSEEIKAYGVECVWNNLSPNNHHVAMAISHEQCRVKAIELDAEFLFHLETDVFIKHRSIIELLVLRRKAAVGAMYHIGLNEKSHLCLVKRHQMHAYELPAAFTYHNGADLMFVDGTCKQIASAGLGAMLIHKSVFRKVSFRHDPTFRDHPDSMFMMDCHYAGIPIHVDTSLLVEHRNERWLHYA